jgi:hypothetical protein
MVSRLLKLAAATAGAFAVAGGSAALAAGGPPPPVATNGHTVTTVASGGGAASSIHTPTSFAFGGGSIFEGDGGPDSNGPPAGGVYVLKGGTGVKLAGSPQFVAGLTWHQGALYISGAELTATGAKFQILKWSGWNGTTFAKQQAIYTAPKKFQGFNGLAFGPDGRLYVGSDVGLLNNNDHGPAKSPYVYSILSMKANGKGLKVFATGMRQPWQFAFTKSSNSPFVSDLGQDSGAKNPPDFVLRVKQGDNYGFPKCNWITKKKCKRFTKPYKFFAPHTDVMGMAIIGKTLYMTEFSGAGGKGKGGEVVSMPLAGGPVKKVLTGSVAPFVGLGANGGKLYVGELTGTVYSIKP